MNIRPLYRFFVITLAVSCLLAGALGVQNARAADGGVSQEASDAVPRFRATNLPLPRFVSIASNEVNVRSGPALRYPIKWIFQKRGLPVEIIQEFDHWRKIRDHEGEEGWVHKSLLSGRRSVIIDDSGLVEMYDRTGNRKRLVARLEPGVVARAIQCIEEGWCEIEKDGYSGWVDRNFLWGIYEREIFN